MTIDRADQGGNTFLNYTALDFNLINSGLIKIEADHEQIYQAPKKYQAKDNARKNVIRVPQINILHIDANAENFLISFAKLSETCRISRINFAALGDFIMVIFVASEK